MASYIKTIDSQKSGYTIEENDSFFVNYITGEQNIIMETLCIGTTGFCRESDNKINKTAPYI